MIKLGLGLLGVLAVAAPIGYKLYKDSIHLSSSDSEDIIDSETETTSPPASPEELSDEVSESLPQVRQKELSEDQSTILSWASSNGGCKIKVYDESSEEYKEISELEKNFDLSGLYNTLTSNPSYWKGSCEIANSNHGHRSANPDAIEGMHFKKSSNKWVIDEGDDQDE